MPDNPEQPSLDIRPIRSEYTRDALDEAQALPDPIQQFAKWFAEAQAAGAPEPNAMTLATVDASGRPSARVLLLKWFDSSGFVFFTNYHGRKAAELQQNPQAAMVFFWQILERQVRIEGITRRVTRQESEEYFHLRPRAAQIGAWVSEQSSVVPSRAMLEQREKELIARFGTGPIPLPEFWGGYRLEPRSIEFWQGRPSRLHDRLLYTKSDRLWTICRLAP